MANDNKRHPSILGGSSLKEKLSKAREELDALQEEKDVGVPHGELIGNDTINKTAPKFHLTGRCNRKDQKYTIKAFYILDELEQDIKKYCNGGDVALFNYLIFLGLNEIKKREGHSFDEVSNMENCYLKK
ncbi:hypothetical protein SAMN02746093_02873 [Legionella quinlivanii DSM 21216]|uniref:hypothetical protein n=1 Tax=Legionella quinlivanii TaxID=45073 RepID=UPI00089F27A4|nr:hypothetical protein [Legionella quinlivanii]SEG41926.1 hypothetical protein SAMN02746093_02873 [Legionella quinlivanii DSM 21216]